MWYIFPFCSLTPRRKGTSPKNKRCICFFKNYGITKGLNLKTPYPPKDDALLDGNEAPPKAGCEFPLLASDSKDGPAELANTPNVGTLLVAAKAPNPITSTIVNIRLFFLFKGTLPPSGFGDPTFKTGEPKDAPPPKVALPPNDGLLPNVALPPKDGFPPKSGEPPNVGAPPNDD